MEFRIRFTYRKHDNLIEGEIRLWGEDVRFALRLVESDLDILGAKVLSVVPVEDD